MVQGRITFREKYNVSKYQHLKRPQRNLSGPPRQPQIIPEDPQELLKPQGALRAPSITPQDKNVVRKLGSLGERLGEPLEHPGRPCALLSIPCVWGRVPRRPQALPRFSL